VHEHSSIVRPGAAAWLGAALVAFALAGCTRFDVRTRQDPAADLGRVHTYAWLPVAEAEPADQRVNDRLVDRQIRAATENELRTKGYQPADGGRPDVLLNYRVSTSPTEVVHANQPQYLRGMWDGWSGMEGVYDSYDVGTLYIAVLDGTEKRMIWVGAARTRLLPHVSDEKRMKRVDAAIHQILASFPKR
jgi:hypothetical protein